MSMDYLIRNAESGDLDRLEELERACFSDPWTRSNLLASLPNERNEFLVAEGEDGEILGYAAMMTVLDEGDISNVAVLPSARRRGIGRALVTTLLALAEKRRLSFVTLEVRASNAGAIALYKRAGFAPVGCRRGYYTHPKEDALLMTISLCEERE